MSYARTVLFWLHLSAGVVAGLVVLIMSATGVVLTYEKQMLEWADRRAWSVPPPEGAPRLSPETLLAAVREASPEAAPATLTLRADPAAPATVALDGGRALLVDPYTGAIIGPPPAGLRTFFRTVTSWHRWLALEGQSRATGKAITGAANLLFLFIVLSGMYLWLPRVWTWLQVRQVLWFRRGLAGKARDFNWHHVVGIWSAVPLAIVVAGAVPISYQWAGRLVYHVVGEEPPAPPPRPAAGPARAASGPGGAASASGGAATPERRAPVDLAGLDAGQARVVAEAPGWRTITIRLPQGPDAPLTLTVDEGYGGQPQHRGTVTLARGTGDIEQWERFADLSAGRRLRSWFRFAHTGEFYGLAGQTVAGLVSAGGVVLVWTGLALTWRRFAAWRARRRRQPAIAIDRAA